MPEKRILLVEDDEDVGELLALTLADAGYQVDVATTAAESWARLAAQGYSLCHRRLAAAGWRRLGHRRWRRRSWRQDLHHERLSAGTAERAPRGPSLHDETDPAR